MLLSQCEGSHNLISIRIASDIKTGVKLKVKMVALLCWDILLAWFGSTYPLRGKSHFSNPLMIYFCPDGHALFQDGPVFIHRVNDLMRMKIMPITCSAYWLYSHHLDPTEHLWEILKWCVRHHSSAPSSKHKLREYLLEESQSSLQYTSRDL